MKKLFLAVILLAIGATAFVSCGKTDVDSEKPVIKLLEPQEDELVKPGSALHLKIELSDNVALRSYKVEIHGNFDGHTHNARAEEAADAVEFKNTWTEADFVKLGETPILDKQTVTIDHKLIEIPETINGKPVKEGHYHLMIHCTDRAGNQKEIFTEINISHTGVVHDHDH